MQGGQIQIHRVRMMSQVIRYALVFTSLIGLCSFLLLAYYKITPYEWAYFKTYHLAEIKLSFTPAYSKKEQIQIKQEFEIPGKKPIQVSSFRFKNDPFVQRIVDRVWNKIKECAFQALFVSLCSFFSSAVIWILLGRKTKQKKLLEGTEVIPVQKLKKLICKRKLASDIKIAGVPLVKNAETQHMLVVGTTGVGKTNCINSLLLEIQKRGDRAIIIDTKGDHVARFYNENKDCLLNPADQRTASWSPFADCLNEFQIKTFASSLIPSQGRDPFWENAARIILTEAMKKLIKHEDLTLKSLRKYTIGLPLDQLQDFYADTQAVALVDKRSRETISSIRSVLSVGMEALQYLEDRESPFSIRDWIEKGGGWLFLSCTPSLRESLRPLLTAWISIASNALMSLEEDINRRLWFIIDELPSLNLIHELSTLLAEGRKYGACVVLGMQDLSQLDKIYGYAATSTITNLCRTKVVFQLAGYETAERLSKNLGTQEISEKSHSLSFGAHEMRDGVSLSEQKRTLPAVSSEMLMSLPSLTAYLKLPENLSVAKVAFSYLPLKEKAAAFIEKHRN